MPYWELYYHIVTATKGRLPLISSEMEPILYAYLKEKAGELEATLYAINGTSDHVHLVVSVPPKIAVATFIGQIKGYTSTQIRQYHPQFAPFSWQAEYGVFSFDKKRIGKCIEYVERQKIHHAQGSVIPVLELSEAPVRRIGEEHGAYDVVYFTLKALGTSPRAKTIHKPGQAGLHIEPALSCTITMPARLRRAFFTGSLGTGSRGKAL